MPSPKNLSVLQTWHDAGITEIAFNLELYNRLLAKAYMPGKGSIPLSQYISAFDKAVSLWGNTGNVRTLFIAGLESQENLLEGIEAVCCHGVMPILSIFRALYQTKHKTSFHLQMLGYMTCILKVNQFAKNIICI